MSTTVRAEVAVGADGNSYRLVLGAELPVLAGDRGASELGSAAGQLSFLSPAEQDFVADNAAVLRDHDPTRGESMVAVNGSLRLEHVPGAHTILVEKTIEAENAAALDAKTSAELSWRLARLRFVPL